MIAPFPHHYHVELQSTGAIEARLALPGRAPIDTAAPPEFDGLPDAWGPEHLLLGAVAACYHATLVAIARAAHVVLHDFRSEVDGTLEKTRDGPRFTSIVMHVHVGIEAPDLARGTALLEKAKRACIVAGSLNVPVTLEPDVHTVDAPAAHA